MKIIWMVTLISSAGYTGGCKKSSFHESTTQKLDQADQGARSSCIVTQESLNHLDISPELRSLLRVPESSVASSQADGVGPALSLTRTQSEPREVYSSAGTSECTLKVVQEALGNIWAMKTSSPVLVSRVEVRPVMIGPGGNRWVPLRGCANETQAASCGAALQRNGAATFTGDFQINYFAN